MFGEVMTPATPFVTRCRDGYDKTHPAVRAVNRYSLWGIFGMLFGCTATPRRIDFVCPRCGSVFGSITDRATLRKFRYGEPRIDEN